MKIEQKKLSNRHTFTFDAENLNFAYKNKTGAGDVDISYGEIPFKSSIQIEQNEWLRNVGYLWCALSIFQIGYALYGGHTLKGTGFWLVVGLLCVMFAYLTKVTYTVFSTDQGNIFIIQDGKAHNQIINEIYSRRKNQLLSWYGDINIENGIEREISKIRWLAEQKVLTKEEAELRIAQVKTAFNHGTAASTITIN
ncbi:MAG: hypothetical protein HZB95_08735 [Nitrosomonadales bacterium]|nr:hypothetical protein [Nitrosomonadales bacterium]